MAQKYDAIYLSPHLDDAALSCGGQVFQAAAAGQRILILTVMAGDAGRVAPAGYAALLHERWQLGANGVAQRRREDATACRILGAAYQHWDVPDCIYRTDGQNQPLYADWAQITGSVHPADAPLAPKMAERLAQLPPAGRVVAPLAVGRHVDHQIVRQAAEMVYGKRLFYYEDYPYAQAPGALDEIISPAGQWTAVTIPLSARGVQVKARAIEAYVSQISTFFRDRDDLLRQITTYAQITGGERLWQRQ